MPTEKFGAERLLGANQAPRCQHIKFNGERCGCPALQGKPVCRFHADTLETATPEYALPFIEGRRQRPARPHAHNSRPGR